MAAEQVPRGCTGTHDGVVPAENELFKLPRCLEPGLPGHVDPWGPRGALSQHVPEASVLDHR